MFRLCELLQGLGIFQTFRKDFTSEHRILCSATPFIFILDFFYFPSQHETLLHNFFHVDSKELVIPRS